MFLFFFFNDTATTEIYTLSLHDALPISSPPPSPPSRPARVPPQEQSRSKMAPSLNVTVPVGVPEPGETAVTVAVKVTDWPKTEGFCEEAKATALVALLTVCVKVAEMFVLKLPSPLYATVIEWEVTDKVELV